jgi:hypothetical protein
MPDELTLNLLFSATYVEMHAEAGKPPREVRIAHNHARRLLADRYGFEEFLALDQQVATRAFFRRSPMAAIGLLALPLMLILGRDFYTVAKRPKLPKVRIPDYA